MLLELYLDGLDCAHCAQKIESKINESNKVKNAILVFVTKTLKIEMEDVNEQELVIEEVKSIVKKLEPHVVVSPKDGQGYQATSSCSCCDHGHNNDNHHNHSHTMHQSKKNSSGSIIGMFLENKPLIIGATIFILVNLLPVSGQIKIGLQLITYLLIGHEILLTSLKNISRGQVFDENFLMSIATIGAIALGEYNEAIGVMLFYQIGETFQSHAVNNSRKNIADLLNIKAEYANLLTEEGIKKLNPAEIKVGDKIIVKPGEKIPLDGIIVEGNSSLDTMALTGESMPRQVDKGDNVLSGCVNTTHVITVEVTKILKNSTVSKILNLVENASAKKSPTENFITKFAKYYTPIVVFAAISLALLPPLFLDNTTFAVWVQRALIFLVVSCPCALVVSIPLGFFSGIGAASKHGILIKGGNYLEALNDVNTIVFDKTGTLTKGIFEIQKTRTANEGISEGSLLYYAFIGEYHSNHPIAKSITKDSSTAKINEKLYEYYKELSGYGIETVYDGEKILIGNEKLMIREDIDYLENTEIGSVAHVSVNGKYKGYIVVADTIKPNLEGFIDNLKQRGIHQAIMLTGDVEPVAKKIANQLNLDQYKFGLLPHEKVSAFEEIQNQSTSSKIAFVGDGINDAPVLARADVGISMGGIGSDAAIEASDIVLMTDEPNKIVDAIGIANKTKRIVSQNIFFALAIKIGVLVLGALGLASMWAAIFADVGVALLAILNVTRILRYKSIQ